MYHQVPLPTHYLDEEINRNLAQRTGLDISVVEMLRKEFKKYGRNPMEATIEILAIENGLDEEQVKNLFDLHHNAMRRLDGFSEQKKNF